MTEGSTPDLAATLTAMMHEWADGLAPLREAAMGYRKQLMDDGVGAEFADSMMADYHRFIVANLINGITS